MNASRRVSGVGISFGYDEKERARERGREESEERKQRERNAQVSKRGFHRVHRGGDQMIVYGSEKERCCAANKGTA